VFLPPGQEALLGRGVKTPERIILLNDTVATLLSGLSQIPVNGGLYKGADTYGITGGPMIGLILGTGCNMAYPEKAIPKADFYSDSSPQIVNCESGNCIIRYIGALDNEFHATTKNPGDYILEKTSAGAYLGPLTFHILKKAINEKVLSFKKSEYFTALPSLETHILSKFLDAPLAMDGQIAELFDGDELDVIRSITYITSIITRRGALFTAAVVAAAVERMGSGHDPFSPVRIAVDGTTYMAYKGMRQALESSLNIILNQDSPRSYVIAPVEQASLLGAAVAALSE